MIASSIRKIALDTETTGVDWASGDRIIEIACIEIFPAQSTPKTFHALINPDCEIDESGTAIHGYTWADLYDKPMFSEIAADFLTFVQGAELILHNADFDVGFLNAELARLGLPGIESCCTITCTLTMARRLYPGQPNSIDVLGERLGISTSSTQSLVMRDAVLVGEIHVALSGSRIEFQNIMSKVF